MGEVSVHDHVYFYATLAVLAFEDTDSALSGHHAYGAGYAHAVGGDDYDCFGLGGGHAAAQLFHGLAGGGGAGGGVARKLGDYFAAVGGDTGVDKSGHGGSSFVVGAWLIQQVIDNLLSISVTVSPTV